MADSLFTEFFPMDKAFPPFPYTVTLDLPTSIIIVCIIMTLFFLLVYHILHEIFYWLLEERPNGPHQNDLEQGIQPPPASIVTSFSHQAAIYQALVQNNLQVMRILERFMCDIEEMRGERLRATKKLPPLVKYESQDLKTSSTACSICLEDFEVGHLCQVFPVCKHIYHWHCIDNWLMKKLTCPICRHCIID